MGRVARGEPGRDNYGGGVPTTTVFSVPLRVRFRGLTVREGVLLQGAAGWGEFSPFWDYDDAESLAWWRAAREAAETGWPEPVRMSIPVNVTVPAVGPEPAARIVTESGCRTAKVKVAEADQEFSEDIERVAAVRHALGRRGLIRIDANGAWDVETAIDRIRRLDRAARGLQYVEQPCRTVSELAAVRRAVDVPIAADESIRRAADPLEVVRAEAADIAILKVQPLGGVRAALELADRLGIPVVVSSALESSVGLAAGLALAAALPELPYACGLATAALFERDVVVDRLLPVDGEIAVRRPVPDPGLLAAAVADEGVIAAWRRRIAAMSSLEASR